LTEKFRVVVWMGFLGFACVFEGCFGKRPVAGVVFLWSGCGGLRGKRGQKIPSFGGLKTGQGF
jgi:hypothetical protein